MARLRKFDPVIVTWEDAHSDYEDHNADKYVANYKPMIRKTIGFLLAKTATHVFVAMDNDSESMHATDGKDVQTITTIPLRMVESIDLAA